METDLELDRNGMGVLSRSACMQRLGRGGLGHIGVTVGALPAVFPVSFALDGESLFFRTAPGTKLAAASRNAVVAFEVDDVDRFAHTGWSVLVIGRATEVVDADALDSLADLPLARWIAGGPETLIRIDTELVSGREITHVVPDGFRTPTGNWMLANCPACGSDALRSVSDGELANILCMTCLTCWHVELGTVSRIPPSTCPGCEVADLCRAANLPTSQS